MASDNWDDYLVGGADTSGSTNITHSPDIESPAGAFLENVGRGLTMNGTDYANAGLLSLWNKQPGQSFGDAFNQHLTNIRARNAQIQQDHPIASTAGNITGNVIGTTFAPGKGIIANMAKNAVQGGVTNYTSSADTTAGTAATQAGFSAGLTGLLGSAGKYAPSLITGQIQKYGIKSNLNKLNGLLTDATDANSATAGQSQQSLAKITGAPWAPTAEDLANPSYDGSIALEEAQALKNTYAETLAGKAKGALTTNDAAQASSNLTGDIQSAAKPNASGIPPGVGSYLVGQLAKHPLGVLGGVANAAYDPGDWWEKTKAGAEGIAWGEASQYAGSKAAKYMGAPLLNAASNNIDSAPKIAGVITSATQPGMTPLLTPKTDWSQYETQDQTPKTDWSQYEVK